MSIRKKAAVFADVQNIYYTTRQVYRRSFDYRKLWETITDESDIVAATAYAIDRGDSRQRKFQNALEHIGFVVKLKPYIQRSDGSAKGDWDVGITIDVLEQAAAVDRIVLLSGDGDFGILLDQVRVVHGVETVVYGVPQLTARALIDSATHFHGIDEKFLL